jgi:hypothetical protein
MKLLFSGLIFLSSVFASAQILNVESLRKATDTTGWSGAITLDVTFSRNQNDLFLLSNDIHVQYKQAKSLVLFKNQFKFIKLEGEDFSNSGIQHLRYNYKLNAIWTWEAFLQAQYNKISKIDFRGLAGTGFRFKLSKAENFNFYLGILMMYEYESLSDNLGIQRDFRNSSYFSFSLYPNDMVSIVSTTYYQPLLKHFNDYRVATESSLVFKIHKNFLFKITHTFTYDTNPASEIQKSNYNLKTGVAYSFN